MLGVVWWGVVFVWCGLVRWSCCGNVLFSKDLVIPHTTLFSLSQAYLSERHAGTGIFDENMAIPCVAARVVGICRWGVPNLGLGFRFVRPAEPKNTVRDCALRRG